MKKLNTIPVLIFILAIAFTASCKKKDTSTRATIKTLTPLYTSSSVVTIGMSLTDDGGSTVTDAGLFMGTADSPETTGNKLVVGADTGTYLIQVHALTPNTKYYVKAYAINANGIGLGDLVTFTTPPTITDYDNNIYETVQIENQRWMGKNLKTTHFMNGDPIPSTTPANLDISNESTPKYTWAYNGDEVNTTAYGKLYTFYAVTDTRKVCPTGWHVPTDLDWTTLESSLGGYQYAASDLKESGNSHWVTPYNLDATNITIFYALPGGYRNSTGAFSFMGNYGFWWTSTEGDATYGWSRSMSVQTGVVTRSVVQKNYGVSVRCIKD